MPLTHLLSSALLQAGAAVAAAGARKGLLDNYDDAEGYYNFQVGLPSWGHAACPAAAAQLAQQQQQQDGLPSTQRAQQQHSMPAHNMPSSSVARPAAAQPVQQQHSIMPPVLPGAGLTGA